MKFNQFLKTWAVVIILPVFSIAIATAAVALQDGNLVPVTDKVAGNSQPDQQQTGKNTAQTTTALGQHTSSTRANTTKLISWKKVRTQDGLIPPPQDDGFPTFPNVIPPAAQDDAIPGLKQDQEDSEQPIARANLGLETINPELGNWKGASYYNTATRLGDTIRSSWVHLGENGSLTGTIQPPYPESSEEASFISVFVLKNGQLIAETRTNESGEFTVEGLKEGTYALIGYGRNSFVAVGFNALKYRPGYRNNRGSLDLLAAERQGFLIAEFVKSQAPTVAFRNYKLYETGEESGDPSHLFGFAGLTTHDPSSTPSNSVENRRVKLVDGRMVGRLHQIDNETGRPIEVANTTVQLIQGDQLIASTQVDYYGVFEFEGLAEGIYGVVAGGRDGFGAVGVELVGSSTPASDAEHHLDAHNSTRSFARFVSSPTTTHPVPYDDESFDMTLASPETMGWINHYVTDQAYIESISTPLPPDPEQYAAPFSQGLDPYALQQNRGLFGGLFGGGGGGGFGGGGLGGGGGFGGGLFFPVGIGAIIANAVNDHDGGSIIIASPSN